MNEVRLRNSRHRLRRLFPLLGLEHAMVGEVVARYSGPPDSIDLSVARTIFRRELAFRRLEIGVKIVAGRAPESSVPSSLKGKVILWTVSLEDELPVGPHLFTREGGDVVYTSISCDDGVGRLFKHQSDTSRRGASQRAVYHRFDARIYMVCNSPHSGDRVYVKPVEYMRCAGDVVRDTIAALMTIALSCTVIACAGEPRSDVREGGSDRGSCVIEVCSVPWSILPRARLGVAEVRRSGARVCGFPERSELCEKLRSAASQVRGDRSGDIDVRVVVLVSGPGTRIDTLAYGPPHVMMINGERAEIDSVTFALVMEMIPVNHRPQALRGRTQLKGS